MKNLLLAALVVLFTATAHAQYQQVNLTVFGMDCAPCAHAIHVSMKGIQGVQTVDVDLNTGLVKVKLDGANIAAMHQFNDAVEKNGFTHKDATITARGRLTGTPATPVFEVLGTPDRYKLTPAPNLTALLGKPVTLTGNLPQAPKGKVPDTLNITTIAEAK